MTAHQFLWLDLETTGLIPGQGHVLEFAAVLCEDARGDDFAIVERYTGVVHLTGGHLANVDPYVQRMHANNGLWDDAQMSRTTIKQVDQFLSQLAHDLANGQRHAVTLAGSSVHFDLAWCRVHLPGFADYLSHRVFDVRALMSAADAWCPDPVTWPVRNTHRALPDILTTIEEARIARRAMGWGA